MYWGWSLSPWHLTTASNIYFKAKITAYTNSITFSCMIYTFFKQDPKTHSLGFSQDSVINKEPNSLTVLGFTKWTQVTEKDINHETKPLTSLRTSKEGTPWLKPGLPSNANRRSHAPSTPWEGVQTCGKGAVNVKTL